MHPEKASFLAGRLLKERLASGTLRRGAPNLSFAAPNFNYECARKIMNIADRRYASRNPRSALSASREKN